MNIVSVLATKVLQLRYIIWFILLNLVHLVMGCINSCCKACPSFRGRQVVITTPCDKCPQLREQLKEYEEKFEKTVDDERKRSDLVTDYMSKAMMDNEDIEDMNNPLSNSKIANHFGQIRKTEWRSLFKCMEDKSRDEVKTVNKISKLLRDVYEKCKDIADSKVRQLASLPDSGDLPDKTKFRDVYRCRRIYGQNKDARENIVSKISDECLQTFLLNEESGCSPSETNSKNVNGTESTKTDFKLTDVATKFLKKCVDCCWLMVISQPNIELTFGVEGKTYTQSMEENFMKYSTQANVTDIRSVGTVVSVVWPELDDFHGTHSKGIVVTVDMCLY